MNEAGKSPVEAHALYDGQLVPLGDRRGLVRAGLWWSCLKRFRARAPLPRGSVNTSTWPLPSSLSSLRTTAGQELVVSASAWNERGKPGLIRLLDLQQQPEGEQRSLT